MPDIRPVFDWAREHGEVKAVDRILVKVMLVLVKNRITLTAAAIEKMDSRIELPEDVGSAIARAAEEVVGQKLPQSMLAGEASHA